jgi:hypothetical protein
MWTWLKNVPWRKALSVILPWLAEKAADKVTEELSKKAEPPQKGKE